MRNKIWLRANAKLNLALSITGKDGNMHTLDSIVVPIKLHDTVVIRKRRDFNVTVAYQDGRRYENDTARIMAELIRDTYKTRGVDILIKKRIPQGAGMGGSSADAAGVARGMEKLFKYGKTDVGLLKNVGSDVPCMYLNSPCRIGGIGEKAEILAEKRYFFVIKLAKDAVNSATCYRLYDEIGGEDGDVGKAKENYERGEIFRPFNALKRAAERLEGQIGDNLRLLEDAGFVAGMTGSGSAVFGMENERRNFLRKLKLLRGQDVLITRT